MRRQVLPDVGLVAPSSPVGPVEFGLGVERLRAEGGKVFVHPQTRKHHQFFAGTDRERAQAFFEFAHDPRFPIVWYARGGYGAARLLPLLDELTRKRGKPPRKLLAGYSDATAFHEYVRQRWGWSTLHSAMPGLRKFCQIPSAEWRPLTQLLRGEGMEQPFGRKRLRFIGPAPRAAIRAPLTGGNLCVWTSLVGTPYEIGAKGKIVFFEEVDESLYRIDRMVHQLLQSNALRGAKALVLGNFTGCRDAVSNVLSNRPKNMKELARMLDSPKPGELMPLRKQLESEATIRKIFGQIGEELGIPVAYGLPIGHGEQNYPLPLGGRYELTPGGALRCLKWDWDGGR